jgi:hypothetical protein
MNADQRTQRQRERFCSDAGFVVIPADGSAPWRPDGQPLTEADRAHLAGETALDKFMREHPDYKSPEG